MSLPRPRPLAPALHSVARRAMGRAWQMYGALLEHWPAIVGEDYARYARPVKIAFPKGKTKDAGWTDGRRTDGVLHIALPQGLAMEFSYRTETIRQRIAACFGYDAIARIVLEPSTARPSKPAKTRKAPSEHNLAAALKKHEAALNSVEDAELRQALTALARRTLADGR